MKTLSFLALVALVTAGPAAAQSTDPHATEKAVAQYLVSDSVAEVALSRLALQKSQNAAVKTFAQRMISDHTAAIAQTVALAKAQNLGQLTMEPAEDGVIELDHLTRYSGHLFDENFLQHNHEDHTQDIEALRHAAEVTANPAVKAFENQQLVLLETHLQLVEQTMDQVAQTE